MIAHSKPTVGEAEGAAVARVVASGNLAQGTEVAAFEEACASFLGRRYAIAVNSGTAALHLALVGLNVRPEDSVAIPSYACASLAQAVSWQHAHPILCDIDSQSNLDPAMVPDSARAVVVPHMFGATATLPEHPRVVEDLAQSFGGDTGRGTIVSMTSFYATKLMTTGEGGMIFTDDSSLAEFMRDRRDYDNRSDFQIRYAYKMTDFQAALGRVQLSRLPEFLARRRAIAARYHDALHDSPLVLPAPGGAVYFRYVVSTPEGPALMEWLNERGIGAGRPVHHPAHHTLGGIFPRSEQAHQHHVSIPIYPAMSDAEVEVVVESIEQFFEARS